jgi:transposase
VAAVREALTGPYRPAQVLALRQALARYDSSPEKSAACDTAIAATLAALEPERAGALAPLPAARDKTRPANDPPLQGRAALWPVSGTDLSPGHGGRAYTALQLVGECGMDMPKWPPAQHCTAGRPVAPGNQRAGGKGLRTQTRRAAHRAAKMLRLAAVTVGRTQTALGACYRWLAARLGKAQAVTATARKLAGLFYHALRDGMASQDPGGAYYEEQYRGRLRTGLRRRAKALGDDRVETAVVEGVAEESRGLLCQRAELRYACMAQHHGTWPVAGLCEGGEVSRSGFYAYLQRQASPPMHRNAREIWARVHRIAGATGHSYGRRRMAKHLHAAGFAVGRYTARQLMRQAGLVVRRPTRRRPVTTDSRHGDHVAPNLLARQFDVDKPDQVWAGDLTDVWTAEGWLYVAVL